MAPVAAKTAQEHFQATPVNFQCQLLKFSNMQKESWQCSADWVRGYSACYVQHVVVEHS